jgi:hypothetical protein
MSKTMTVHFTDGTEWTFEPTTKRMSIDNETRLEEFLSENTLALETEDQLYLIPTQNIKYISITPVPQLLLRRKVLTGLRPITEGV